MRIVVYNTAASNGGALSILKSFYNYICSSPESKENEWIFLLSGNYIEETENIKVVIIDEVKKNWINRLKFDLFTGKKVVSKLKPDIVFSLQNTIISGINPQILYMHQSLPFQKEKCFSLLKSSERKMAVYQHIIGLLIKKSIKSANKVIVQTEWIKKEVITSTKINSNKIVSIMPPTESRIKSQKKFIHNRNKFFYPASNDLYKNHECIYKACGTLKDKGVNDFNISLTIEGERIKDNITYMNYISFEKVLKMYAETTLIFPSYIETVGLPLLEARQNGTLILAADCPYSHEVLSDYNNVYYFNPFNSDELAELIEKVINGDIVKKDIKPFLVEDANSWSKVVKIIKSYEGAKK